MGVWSRDDVVTIGRREIAESPRVSGASWFGITFREPVLPGFLGHSQSQSCAGEFFEVGVEEWMLKKNPQSKFPRLNHIVSILTQVTFEIQLLPSLRNFATLTVGDCIVWSADGVVNLKAVMWPTLIRWLSWHNVCPVWPKAPGCKSWFGHGGWRRARLNLRDDWTVLLNFAATKNLV